MIIFLNGVSSAGKSSIAKILLNKLKEPYFIFGVDRFLEPSLPMRINMDIPNDLEIIERSLSGFNKALRCYAQAMDFMIIDHVLHNPKWIIEIAEALQESEVYFVGVTAPLEIIEAREKLRNDRQLGTARSQYEQFRKYQYDILIDTSKCTAEEAADKIIANLKRGTALKSSAKF